jgi:hypothetical protein
MELGELEFKPEDFDEISGTILLTNQWREVAASVASALLREKLSKAPVVHGRDNIITGTTWSLEIAPQVIKEFPNLKPHHEARLVCIQPIESTERGEG